MYTLPAIPSYAHSEDWGQSIFQWGGELGPLAHPHFRVSFVYTVFDPILVSISKFIRLRSTSAHLQPFLTSGDTCTAQARSRTQQPLVHAWPSSQQSRATPHHRQHTQYSHRSLKRSRYTSSPCRCAHRPRRTPTCTVPAPAFTNNPKYDCELTHKVSRLTPTVRCIELPQSDSPRHQPQH